MWDVTECEYITRNENMMSSKWIQIQTGIGGMLFLFFFNESLPERFTEYAVESRAVTWDVTEMSHDCKILLL